MLRRRLDEWRQLLRQAPATAQRSLGLLLPEPPAGIRLRRRIAYGPVFLGMASVNAMVPPG
ncbi:MAG TPA: hypothetical protein VMT79_06895 [Candidatus Binatia bacterium]|nr:hypothetical protein [Candidatus Binatia bacterium]